MPLVPTVQNTGIRRGEAFGIEWTAVDLRRRVLSIRGEIAKDATTRDIPLNREAVTTLKAWKAQQRATESPVFPGKDGDRLTSIKTALNRIFKSAGIRRKSGERIGLHNFRHTFATRLLNEGVDLETVRLLLGHEDIATTALYVHTDEKNMANAVARLVN